VPERIVASLRVPAWACETAEVVAVQARALRLNGSREKIDEGVEAYKSRVAPAFKERDGYRATGEAIAFTVWDSEPDLEASSSQAGPVRATASEVMGASDPQVESYEVAFAELPAPVGT
jgi:hypothetical protein